MNWAEWLADPAAGDYWAFAALRPQDVLAMPGGELVALVSTLLADYFPLALLSMDEEPLPGILAYLGEEVR